MKLNIYNIYMTYYCIMYIEKAYQIGYFCCLQPFKKFKFGPLFLGVFLRKRFTNFYCDFLYIKLHDICLTLTRRSSPQKCFYSMILFKYKVTWYILIHSKMIFVNQKWTQLLKLGNYYGRTPVYDFPSFITKYLFIPLCKVIGCLSVCLSVRFSYLSYPNFQGSCSLVRW